MKNIRLKPFIFIKHLPLALLLAAGVLLSGLTAPRAEASYFSDMYNGIKEFSELPSDINKLKEDYNTTSRQLQEARSDLDSYREQSKALTTQNEQLAEQNRALSATVSELSAVNKAREATTHKLRIMLYTALGLFAGYFVFIRLVRFKLRR